MRTLRYFPILLLVALGCGKPPAPVPPPTSWSLPPGDPTEFQGKWIVTNIQHDAAVNEKTERYSYRFTGDICTISEDGEDKDCKVRWYPSANPKQIDFLRIETDEIIRRGLYVLDGDTLKLCVPSDDGERPAEFKAIPNPGGVPIAIYTLTRAK